MKFVIGIFFVLSINDAQAFSENVYLVEKPPTEFIKVYHKSFFSWLSKNYLKDNEQINKCYDEWEGTAESKSWELFSNVDIRPFFVSYIHTKESSHYVLNILSKSPLNCLNGANGARFSFTGEVLSKFYVNQKNPMCKFKTKGDFIFEVKADNECLLWDVANNKKIDHIVFGFSGESAVPILKKDSEMMNIIYFKDFNPFVLEKGLPLGLLETLRLKWRSKIRAARLFGDRSYELIWH